MRFCGIRFVLCISLSLVVSTVPSMAAGDCPFVHRRLQSRSKIDRNLFGQFAENLGHGLYEGIWVGPDSPIPNTRGIRNDVVTALRELKVPNVRWPGGCFADEYHWRKGIGPAAERPATLNSAWGGVVDTNALAPTSSWTSSADRQPALRLGQRRLWNTAGSGRMAGVHDGRGSPPRWRRSVPQTGIPNPTRLASWASGTRAGAAAAT